MASLVYKKKSLYQVKFQIKNQADIFHKSNEKVTSQKLVRRYRLESVDKNANLANKNENPAT